MLGLQHGQQGGLAKLWPWLAMFGLCGWLLAPPTLHSQQQPGWYEEGNAPAPPSPSSGWPVPKGTGVAANPQFLISSHTTGAGHQQLIVLESATKSLAVYHVHPQSGAVNLVSVRRLDADLAMDEFNGMDPTPSRIRQMLGTSDGLRR
jgi:hypothetical protein